MAGSVRPRAGMLLALDLRISNLLRGVSMASKDRVVFGPSTFGPSTFATSLSSPLYASRPRLMKVRTLINEHFGS